MTTTDLDEQVKQADPDRWLASRFIADEAARTDVLTLYAFNHVLAGIAGSVSEAMLGQIRLAWWREALEEAALPGPVRANPVVEALAETVRRGAFGVAELTALVDAREPDFAPEALAGEAEIEAYIDGTAGALAALAARRLDPASRREQVVHAMRAWGWAGLARNGALPAAWDIARVGARVRADLQEARAETKSLPVAAFPALAYATFSRAYSRGRRLEDYEKRLRLLWATLRGRV